VTDWNAFDIETLLAEQRASGEPWLEFFRAPSMRAGLYVLERGAWDHQSPHEEDEVYHVIAGRATFECGTDQRGVQAGSILYVPAHQPHRFVDIQEELRVLVFFSTPAR
jgi:mannose-6-phosphate isomerase-like protein (cupin superfamily)